MYSIVMLMAMSGAPEMPAWGGRNGGGCCGCNGGGYSCGGGNGCGCRGGMFGGHRCGCGGGWGRGNGCCGNNNSCGCCGQMASSCGCCGQMASSCGCCGGMAMGGAYGSTMVMTSAPATIVVSLPADAKLSFDGNATNSTSANRRFNTPALQTGSDSSYTLTAEIVREGKTLKTSQVITVRAGQTTEVNLSDAQFTTSVVMN
jgi:uncharacterized protein (TIGR03000 family)